MECHLHLLARGSWKNGLPQTRLCKWLNWGSLLLFRCPLFLSPHIYKISSISGSLVQWVECSLIVRETGVQSQFESYQRLKKMILDTFLLNTQHYKVRIKGKVERPSLHLGVVAIKKGAFGSTATTVANNLLIWFQILFVNNYSFQ